jgi:hypothetical protein
MPDRALINKSAIMHCNVRMPAPKPMKLPQLKDIEPHKAA